MLTPFDDYPIHQLAVPLAQAGNSHPDFYDRFWFNGYTEDHFFALAMGIYPNRGVIDAAFSVVHDGVQRSVFATGRAPADRTVTTVGPIRVEIVEPMRVGRIVVDAPEHELGAELTFTARTAAYEEPRQTRYEGIRLTFDVTRATQFGAWSGSWTSGADRRDLGAETVWGTKDRSWGVRAVGQPAPMAPAPRDPQLCFLWAPLNFPSGAVHYMVFEDAEGIPWSEGGAVLPALAAGDDPVGVTADHIHRPELTIDWEPGLRRSRRAELSFQRSGRPARELVTMDPQLTFRMSGVGYAHPTWNHGRWHDELVVAGEAFPTAELETTRFHHTHVQQVMACDWEGERGLGVLEQFVLGPHATRGLTGLTDGYAPD